MNRLEYISYLFLGLIIIAIISIIGACTCQRDRQAEKFMNSPEYQQMLRANANK